MKKIVKNLLVLLIILIPIFCVAHFALALDTGIQYGESTGLGAADPRVIAANIVRIALGFLAILATAFVLYAGFVWMTAGGNEEKIAKAKKILISSLIGLAIILCSFAIVSFIINRMLEATNGTGGGGGDGSVCDPPCSSGQYCCASSCQNSPCSITPPGSNSFYITGTVPKNNTTKVVRNVVVKTFFNKQIATTTSQAALDNNFKVEIIATVNSSTMAETSVTASPVTGILTTSSDWKELDFKAMASCGDERNTQNCLSPWTKYQVTVNGASGIITNTNQGLSCLGNSCRFEFSTGDLVDTGPPTAGIIPAQICKDDGTLKADANTVGGWGKDDVGISALSFYEQRIGFGEALVYSAPGNSEKYLTAEHKYNTASMNIGDQYIFNVKAFDMANDLASSSFSATVKPGHCCNGVKDVFVAGDPRNEEDTDCGGSECLACSGGKCNKSEPNQCTLGGSSNCDDNLCSTHFCDCKPEGCICQQKPTIYSLSPRGGYCEGDKNKYCKSDSDCAGLAPAKCNQNTPNGSAGNFVTIGGKYFGATAGSVFFQNASGSWVEAKLANDSTEGNAACVNEVWSDTQVIAIVPAGFNISSTTIRVRTATSYEDTTQDELGPKIDFLLNSIARPGLCKIDPDHGKLNDAISYYGIKMGSGNAYFGDINQSIAGLNSSFTEKTGTANTPNLTTGKTTTFILKANIASNYLNFIKDEEPYSGPSITSFEPPEGKEGQYVTIYGTKFGKVKGSSKVYFTNAATTTEASYNFPNICKDTVWSDNQIIVKAPAGILNGNYLIRINLGNTTIDTSALANPNFRADSSLALRPSLCRIEPVMGPKNSPVSLWGEYFGGPATGKIRFHLNHDQDGTLGYWGVDNSVKSGLKPDKATTTVHNAAVTGPVKIVQGGLEGNGLNFSVGSCAKNEDCGSGFVCCPQSSPSQGRCLAGTNIQDACYPKFNACVYEWDFSTGFGLGKIPCDITTTTPSCEPDEHMCPSNEPYCNNTTCFCQTDPINIPCDITTTTPSCEPDAHMCPSNVPYCNNTTCFCQTTPPLDSCSGYANQCSESYLCPNSPGQCSTNKATTSPASCDPEALYPGKGLVFLSDLNKFASSTQQCSIDEDGPVTIGGSSVANATATSTDGKYNYKAQCKKVGSKNYWQIDPRSLTTIDGKSTPMGSCPDSGTGNYVFILDANNWCTYAKQSGGSYVKAECVPCSSDFSYNCLANGLNDNNGICVLSQEVCPVGSACNSSTKKCDKINPGFCECCCRIDKSAQDCCAPTTCEGTCGSDTTNDNAGFGLCSGCTVKTGGVVDQDASNDTCNCSKAIGKFCDTTAASGRGVCRDCAQLEDSQQCTNLGVGSCCVDAKKGDSCSGRPGSQSLVLGDSPDLAYCPYYSCVGNTCGSASTTGFFINSTCEGQCTQGNDAFGQTCAKKATTTNQCDPSICSNFSCLDASGAIPAVEPCGICCCDPTPADGVDKCKELNIKLSCLANKGTCNGAERGLCCGCKADTECVPAGVTPLAVGCGLDTCCHARPSVEEIYPGGNDVCRNTIITAKFSELMNPTSFNGNVVLIGDYGTASCPEGTDYLTLNNEKKSLAIRMADIIISFLARVPLLNNVLFGDQAKAAAIAGHNYCALSGSVVGANTADKKTVLKFSVSKLLAADTTYHVIIKGDSNTSDKIKEGVLSLNGIGMVGPDNDTFNAKAFTNSKIWSFTTKPETADHKGVCLLESVLIEPNSYLFQTSQNDSGDDNPGPNYDTIKDSDKVFSATAISSGNNKIIPFAGVYDWVWNWKIANESVAKFKNGSQTANSPEQNIVAQNKQDAETSLEAKAAISTDTVNSPTTVGQIKSGSAQIYVLMCENPWPAIRADGTWQPWKDNPDGMSCVAGSGSCLETNFSLYYCRDYGARGTADDLPAIYSNRAIIRGSSVDILKEYFFLREALPDVSGASLVVSSVPNDGKKVALAWTAIAPAAGETLDKYIVYYGTASRQYTESASTADTVITISGLTNKTQYYFSVTAKYTSGAESKYSNEVNATPEDTASPSSPNMSLLPGDKKVSVIWQDTSGGDAKSFKIFYGATPDFGGSVAVPYAAQGTTTISNLNNGALYYFGMVSYDEYGNQSGYVNGNATPSSTSP